ncbi:MAG: hypothetical protein RSD01_01030 [Ruthenibacterium sp.]
MKQSKTIALTLCAAILGTALTGCSFKTPATVLTVDGKEIAAGLYLMEQMQAYSDASAKAQSADVLKAEVEGVPATEWIHNKTIEGVRRYCYLTKEFDAAGLSFTQEEQATHDTQIDKNYETNSKMLSDNGIGKESYREYYLAEAKYQQLFTAYNEKNKVSNKDGMSYMDAHYSRVKTLILPTTNADGKAVDDATLTKIKEEGESLKKALADGGDFDKLAEDSIKKVLQLCKQEYTAENLTQYYSTAFVSPDGTATYPPEFVAMVMGAKVDEAGIYEYYNSPLVYQKIVNYTDETDFEGYKMAIDSAVNNEKFDAEVLAGAAKLELTENAAAVKTYSPKKIKLQ